MKQLFFFLCLSTFCFSILAQNVKLKTDWWRPNGTVNSIVTDDSTHKVYLGGNFTDVGPYQPNGSIVKGNLGLANLSTASPNDYVTCSVPDGQGGWFIGGMFTKVGDSIRNHIAQIDSNGKVTSNFSNLGFDQYVSDLVIDNNQLIVGGAFRTHGVFKNYFASLKKDGNPDPKFPSANNIVNHFCSDGNGGWYLAGQFSMVGDSVRNFLAQIDSNGHVTSWNPNPNRFVSYVKRIGNTVYASGSFDEVGGRSVNYLAALDAHTGLANNWNPSPNHIVTTIISKNGTMYLCGAFSKIGNTTRIGLAAVDSSTGVLNSWDPNANQSIYKMHRIKDTLYLVGRFTQIGGFTRRNLASIDINNGQVYPWNPNSSSNVDGFAILNKKMYIYGRFDSIGRYARDGMAALDLKTGLPTSWNPGLPGSNINYIASTDSSLIISGYYVPIGNTFRGIVELDTIMGTVSNWTPYLNNYPYHIAISKDGIFVGGNMSKVGGETNQFLTKINLTTFTVDSFNANLNGPVNDMVIKDSILYMVGGFTKIGSFSTNYLGKIDKTTGAPYSWGCNPNYPPNKLAISNNSIILSGNFLRFDTIPRRYIAKINLSDAQLTNWNPDPNDEVKDILVDQNSVYMVGDFTNVGGANAAYLAKVNINTGNLMPNLIQPDRFVSHISRVGNKLYLGGSFSKISTVKRNKVAAWDLNSDTVLAWNPNIPIPDYGTIINTISFNQDNAYIGGEFVSIGGIERNNLACIDSKTGLPTTWNPNADSIVYKIKLSLNDIYVCGEFDTIAGLARKKLAAIDKNTGTPNNFNPISTINGSVKALDFLGNSVYAGGSFSNVNGITRNNVFAIDKISSGLLSWNPDADDEVYDIAAHPSGIFLAGEFLRVGIRANIFLTKVDITTGFPYQINLYPNYAVTSLAIAGGTLYAGGDFTLFKGQLRTGLAAVDIQSASLKPWNPNANNEGFSRVLHKNGKLYVAGKFNSIGGRTVADFALCDTSLGLASSLDLGFHPGSSNFKRINDIGIIDSLFIIPGYLAHNRGDYHQRFSVFSACIFNTSITKIGNAIRADEPGYTYQWLDCNNGMQAIPGETNQYFFPAASGNYAVEVSNGFCSDTSSCSGITTVNLQEKINPRNWSIYPNPTLGEINLNFSSVKKRVRLKLFQLNGKFIREEIFNQVENIQFNIAGNPGIYLLQIEDSEGFMGMEKIIKF